MIMAIYHPLQIQDGPNAGKWHYTCTNSAGTFAVGYCMPIEACPVCKNDPQKAYEFNGPDDCEVCHGKRVVDRIDPCPGHDTAEEAAEHYRQYNLDCAVVHEDAEAQHKCEVCGDWTQKYMTVPGDCFWHKHLCDKHATRKFLDLVTCKEKSQVPPASPTP